MLYKVGVDLPWSGYIRSGVRVARNRLTAKAHVVKPLCLCAQMTSISRKVSPLGELRKGHGKELIKARKVFDPVIAPLLGNKLAKGGHGQELHKLRKHKLAFGAYRTFVQPCKNVISQMLDVQIETRSQCLFLRDNH